LLPYKVFDWTDGTSQALNRELDARSVRE
jgi:hypothetical protein